MTPSAVNGLGRTPQTNLGNTQSSIHFVATTELPGAITAGSVQEDLMLLRGAKADGRDQHKYRVQSLPKT